MPRRVPITLARLLAVACACLVPAASAQAAAPVNDQPSGAQPVSNMSWTSLSGFQDIVVQATEWSSATTGPEDADPLPSCTSIVGFRSMWYSISVPEAAVLRVAVTATDNRYEPVVTVLDPNRDEVGCGRANASKPGSAANATAYVTPKSDGTPTTYLVRVAEFADNSASSGLPTVLVRFAARDVTAPHILRQLPEGTVAPGASTTYDASDSSDARVAGQSRDRAVGVPRQGQRPRRDAHRGRGVCARAIAGRLRARTTSSSASRTSPATRACIASRRVVQDTVRPDVKFSLRPPAAGRPPPADHDPGLGVGARAPARDAGGPRQAAHAARSSASGATSRRRARCRCAAPCARACS